MKLTREIFGVKINAIFILIFAGILVIIYDKILDNTITKEKDPLLNSILPTKNVTGWSFTHFILYLILGYFYSGIEEMFFFTLVGISFEIYEEAKKEFLEMYGIRNSWWTGCVSDISSNSLGLILGNYLAYISGKFVY